MSKTAHIVAIKVSSLGDLGFGISGVPGDITHILHGETWVGPRPVLEEDEDFVQPIPYIVVRKGQKVLLYVRESGGDARLQSRASVGFGGHVDLDDVLTDANGAIDLNRTMLRACRRELSEELGLVVNCEEMEWSHVISCEETQVDRVHVGLVAQVEISHATMLSIEHGIGVRGFHEPAAILASAERGEFQLETWSLLLLRALVAP